jgi:hypothetical protein
MRTFKRTLLSICLTLAGGSAVYAAGAPNVDQLGTSLTEWGAEKAGSSDGQIPAYTGGLPLDTSPSGWKKGSGRYDVGPYDDEKPSLSINSSNVDKYSDKLTAGTVALIKKYPDFRVDVYPTHRSVAHSANWLSHCKSNAENAKLTSTGNGFSDAYSCIPFPLPKSGAEVVWNHEMRDTWGPQTTYRVSQWLVDGGGHLTDVGQINLSYAHPYLDPKKDKLDDRTYELRLGGWEGPPAQVGTKLLQRYPIDYDADSFQTWIYTPGQRRTRVAPEYAYDTPIAGDGGALNYDELFGFAGQLDRYDFKVIGKKEIYIPYNNNRMLFAPLDKLLTKGLVNPDLLRWELHRVWVVEATLKAGKRHVQPRRTLYIDEDNTSIAATDAYDQGGNLFRVGLFPSIPMWDLPTVGAGELFYDLSKGTTFVISFSRPNDFWKASNDVGSLGLFTPAAMTSSGVR